MTDGTDDVLQGYFDNLLGNNEAAEEELHHVPAVSVVRPVAALGRPNPMARLDQTKPPNEPKLPKPLPSRQVVPLEQFKHSADSSRPVAEQLVKQKLQSLLKSVPNPVESQISTQEKRTFHPSDDARIIVEPAVPEEPAPQVQLDAAAMMKERLQAKLQAAKKGAVEEPSVHSTETDVRAREEHEQVDLEQQHSSVSEQDAFVDSWLDNGRPQWAQERFEVLLFDVSGLALAVPLISLGQIQVLTDQLTPLFGQVDWFMGLQPTPMGDIRTVNTALFVMRERYDESFVDTAKYVVTIDGLQWGLAVNDVKQPITLSPDDVKWRSERSKRPWLAGTVKEHMCALLDVPVLGQILERQNHNKALA